MVKEEVLDTPVGMASVAIKTRMSMFRNTEAIFPTQQSEGSKSG